MANVYTHATNDTHAPMTFVKMIVTDAPIADLGLSGDWFQVDPQEVADTEELCGCTYPEYKNLIQIDMRRTADGIAYRRYGRL